jgi:hypothetical protein
MVENLTSALYGQINKYVEAGRVKWSIPCDPNNSAQVPSIPRESGEGLLCYIMRVFNSWVSQNNTVYDIRQFGAISGGTVDCGPAIQAAINAASAAGGGVVFIPSGRWRKSDNAGSTLIMKSNVTMRGMGDQSVIFFDDKPTVVRSGNDMLFVEANSENIWFDSFKVEGTALTYTNETNNKQCFTGATITNLRFTNVTIRATRYMATAFANVRNAIFLGNRIEYCVRDGIRCTASQNVVIAGNNLFRVADDAVVVSSDSTLPLTSEGIVISNNSFEECQTVKALGVKTCVISNNVFRRMTRNAINVVMQNAPLTEGDTPQFAISIQNNVILDTFGSLGTSQVIVLTATTRSNSTLGTNNEPMVNSVPYPYNYVQDVGLSNVVNIGQHGISVSNNIIGRTLSNTASVYADYGYGLLFDRNTVGFFSNPTITSNTFATHGISVYGPTVGISIANNTLFGGGIGFSAIQFVSSGTGNIIDFNDVLIDANNIYDYPTCGIAFATDTGSGNSNAVIRNNIFDLDPFRRSAEHVSDNTWSSVTTSIAIQFSGTIQSCIIEGNSFKNCGSVCTTALRMAYFGNNYVYADLVSPNVNSGNRGVGFAPTVFNFTYITIDANPTSATFGKITTMPTSVSDAIPSTGKYIEGTIVRKNTPEVAGTSPNQYVVTGWWRQTTGTGHVLNTDWRELRANIS